MTSETQIEQSGESKCCESTVEALRALESAKRDLKVAEEIRGLDPQLSAEMSEKAEYDKRRAEERLRVDAVPPIGPAGEFCRPTRQRTVGAVVSSRKPDAITLEASLERLDLIAKTGHYALGLDLAQELKARNSKEKMLAHGMGVTYARAMKLFAEADMQTHPVAKISHINAGDRLFRTFIDAMLAFDKVRSGGTQRVEVRYVNVYPGGQAIVGSVRTGGRGRRRKRRGG